MFLIRIVLLYFCVNSCFAWNMQGHKVIAQIAFDNLTPKAKSFVSIYLNNGHANGLENQFVNSATWLDRLRFKEVYWYDALHYIDIPFSDDHSPVIPVEANNATWAINNAIAVLNNSRTSKGDRRLALLILLHVVGDIHQPLHATTRVSANLPNGDKGGNHFALAHNKIGNNLHQYWDRGAGLLLGSSKMPHVKQKASQIESRFACLANEQKTANDWAQESHQLGITKVYQIAERSKPSETYHSKALEIAEQRVALAGCRLAKLLNLISMNSKNIKSF